MTRILKKQIQKALTIVTLSVEEQTLKYNREVCLNFFCTCLESFCEIFALNVLYLMISYLSTWGERGEGRGGQNTPSHVYSLPF